MAVAQIGSLVTFVGGTTILASEMNSNFIDVKSAFNALVTGTNEISIDTIEEVSGGNGVIVDSVTLKDGGASGAGNLSFADGTFSGDVTVAGGVTVTGALTAGSLVFTSAVTLQGSAPDPENFDIRYDGFTASAGTSPVASGFYAEYLEDGTVNTEPTGSQETLYLDPTGSAASFAIYGTAKKILAEVSGAGGGSLQSVVGLDVEAVVSSNHRISQLYGMKVRAWEDGVPNESTNAPGQIYGIQVLSGGETKVGGDQYGIWVQAPTHSANADGTEELASLYLGDPVAGSPTTGFNDTIRAASGARLTPGGVWTDASDRDTKADIATPDDAEVMAAFGALKPRKFRRKVFEPVGPPDSPGAKGRRKEIGVSDNVEIGVVAQELPDLLKVPGGDGVSPTQLASLALAVLKNHEARLQSLEA